MGVRAERWACVMHVSCAVSPCVDCGRRTVVQLCRLWVHALAVFNIYYKSNLFFAQAPFDVVGSGDASGTLL